MLAHNCLIGEGQNNLMMKKWGNSMEKESKMGSSGGMNRSYHEVDDVSWHLVTKRVGAF